MHSSGLIASSPYNHVDVDLSQTLYWESLLPNTAEEVYTFLHRATISSTDSKTPKGFKQNSDH